MPEREYTDEECLEGIVQGMMGRSVNCVTIVNGNVVVTEEKK